MMNEKTGEVNKGQIMEGLPQHVKLFELCKKERGVIIKEI